MLLGGFLTVVAVVAVVLSGGTVLCNRSKVGIFSSRPTLCSATFISRSRWVTSLSFPPL